MTSIGISTKIAMLSSLPLAAIGLVVHVPTQHATSMYQDQHARNQNKEKNIAISAARPVLSRQCLAHRSAVIADIDIHQASDVKGLGAFATGPIACGTYLGDYSGESMTHNEVRARFWNKREPDIADKKWAESRRTRNQSISGNYIFELQDGSFVCAEDGDLSSWTRFMNHAFDDAIECNVKAFMQTEKDGDIHRYPRFFAIRDIEEGEELQYNYGDMFYTEIPESKQ
mmetsp:Transcript_3007/g.8703  ORF Transcript_3007/g.8703 Transcript_3007/m.8703 type:complete len:228 (+) Transcript_3007:360-1043(+)|eukprot:CAMPEP_0181069148 /NCGR_PEP_ID=MMETSP1070-20121207/26788_1 /TAXON_ID=265543 /ORGANISM="Minutocellus polymorphus, Strain NH13" /LENGTH=227 /DNA_ID=CAMNT_0023149927 /DNA_START=310 /DNA_END=993 /DNA_ORIENTATION=-